MKHLLKTSGALAVFAVAMLATSTTAKADTVEANFIKLDPVLNGVSYTYNYGSAKTANAGRFNWERIGGTWAGLPNLGAFQSFCMEITQVFSSSNPHTFEVVDNLTDVMDVSKATALSQLYGNYFDDVVDSATAGAFQMAVWEIVWEDPNNTFDVTSGKMTINNDPSGARTTASNWLANLGSEYAGLRALVSQSDQDQVYLIPDFIVPSVPLPSAAYAGLALLGVVAIGKAKARNRRKANA